MRYFMPLIIEGNKRSIKSKIFISANRKYNNPLLFKKQFDQIRQEQNVEVLNLSDINSYPDKTFLIEGCGIEAIRYSDKKYSLTYMTDYTVSYDRYINKVDHVILPNVIFAKKYNKISDKNLYLGSPKYDIFLDKNLIYKKYNLSDQKKALVIFPRNRDLKKIDMRKIYDTLRSMGYQILVKTRGKDPVKDKSLRGDQYFIDESWFPHTTMELIEVSDIVINFSSTSIKECVLLKTPLINFDVKSFDLLLDFLYDYPYCEQIKLNFSSQEMSEAIKKLENSNHDEHFNDAIERFLFKKEGTCARILDNLGLE